MHILGLRPYPDHFRQFHHDLADLGVLKQFKPNDIVLTLGGPARPRAALVDAGLVKVTAYPAGEAARSGVLLSLRGNGSLLGEEAAIERGPRRAVSDQVIRVMALTHVRASIMDVPQLRWYLRGNPDALLAVARDGYRRLAEAEERIASTSRDSARRRLARLLCDLEPYGTDDYGGPEPGTRIPVQLSHAEYGSLIGVGRETISKILGNWRDRGLVSIRYKTIVMHDFKTLRQIAGVWPATVSASA